MTPYDPHHWTSHLFDIEGSMVREISGRVVLSVVWCGVYVLLFYWGPAVFSVISIPAVAHTLVGTVLSLLLVFRTNSSYDRFWEGRKQWGGMTNECRNLARQASNWLSADPELSSQVISWTAAFPYAVMERLRSTSGELVRLDDLPPDEVKTVAASQHPPLAVARVITRFVLQARERGLIDSLQLTAMDNNVQLLIDYCGACERIRSTPLPFAYAVHLRRFVILYCATLPLALVKDFGWETIPAVLMISYSLFGIEEIGVEIENPFGTTPNDLPLETFCASIRATLTDVRRARTV